MIADASPGTSVNSIDLRLTYASVRCDIVHWYALEDLISARRLTDNTLSLQVIPRPEL